MGKQVDNRVVQMQFDNKKFEQGIQTTLKSINNLDNSLNALNKISLNGLEKLGQIAGKVNFDTIGVAADAVASRMSAMGVVGATVLQNLTNAAINTAKHLGNITIGQIMTGGKNRALNLEQAKFQLEGLGVAWEDIKDNINNAVSGTAYGLDAAAKTASQLVASGIKVGDEMENALTAVSGVAAMTNSSYEDIGQIFTTIAGNGRLMGMQLTQLSTKGLNVAASLGKALGKTEGEIREMVSKGKIDFKMFSEAMYDAFADHAKEANNTFTGALSNMKAALSRIGAEFYTPGLKYGRDIFNSITTAVNQLKSSMADYHIFELASNIMEKLTEKTTAFFESISDQGGMNRFAGGALKTVQGVLGTISSFLNKGFHTKILDVLGIAIKNVGKIFRAVFAGIKVAFPEGVLEYIADFINFISSRVKEFDKTATVYERIRNTVAGLASVLRIVWKTVSAVWKVFGDPILDWMLQKIKDLLGVTSDFGKKLNEFSQNYKPFEKLSNGFSEFSSKWRLSMAKVENHFQSTFGKSIPEIIDKFKNKLLGAFKVDDITKEASKIASKGNNPYVILAKEMGKSEAEIRKMISNGEISFNEFADAINKSLGEGTVTKKASGLEKLLHLVELLEKGLIKLIDVFGFFYKTFSGIIPISDIVDGGIEHIKEAIVTFADFLRGADFGGDLSKNLSPGLREFLTDMRDVFLNFKKIIGDAFGYIKPLYKGFIDTLKNLSFNDILKSGGLAAAIIGIKKLVDYLLKYKTQIEWIKTIRKQGDAGLSFVLKTEISKITDAFGAVSGFFNQLKKQTKDSTADKQLKNIAISIGILAVSMMILSNIDQKKLIATFGIITALFAEMFAAFKKLDKMLVLNDNPFKDITLTLLGLSVALLIMASAMKKLGRIDAEKLGAAFFVLSSMLGELVGAIYLLSMIEGDVPKIGGTIIGMSVALLIMASALKKLAKLDADQLAGAAVAMTLMLVELGGALFLLSEFADVGELVGVAGAFLVLALALNALVVPLTVMALLGDKLGPAITDLAVLLTILGLFAGIMSMVEGGGLALAGVGAGLLVLAAGLTLLVVPLTVMSMLGSKLEPAITDLAVLLTILGLFAGIMMIVGGGGLALAGVGAGLIVLAAGLTLLMVPLTVMASLEGKIGTAITELTVLLIVLGIFTGVMSAIGGAGLGLVAVGAGLIVLAAGLSLLMVPLSIMASIEGGQLKQAIIGLAALLGILSVMVLLAVPLGIFSAALISVGTALKLIGIGIALSGVGMLAYAASLYLIIAGFKLLIETMTEAGDKMLEFAVTAANSIVAFLLTLGNAGPQLVEGISNIIDAGCDAILHSLVKIVDTIGQLLIGILDSLTERAPTIILDLLELVVMILDGLLKGLTTYVPILARDIYNFCMEVLDELVKLMKQTPLDLIDIFFGGGFDKDKNSGKKLGEWFKGIFHKEKDNKDVQQAGKDTAEAITDATSEELESKESQNKVNNSMGSLVSGMSDYISGDTSISQATSNLSEGALEGLENPLDIVGGKSMATYDIAGFANEGFLSGAEDGVDKFFDVGKLGGENYIDGLKEGSGVASPSWKAMEVAKFVDEGFAIGIKKSTESEKALESKGNSMISILGDTMSNTSITPLTSALSAFSAALSSEADYQPTISPIMDLSNLNSGFGQIDSMFSSRRSLSLAGDASFIQNEGKRLSLDIQNGQVDTFNGGFTTLGSKLDRLGEAIMNRQIVLDSGELVGGLINPMDRSLGVRAIKAQRGGAR